MEGRICDLKASPWSGNADLCANASVQQTHVKSISRHDNSHGSQVGHFHCLPIFPLDLHFLLPPALLEFLQLTQWHHRQPPAPPHQKSEANPCLHRRLQCIKMTDTPMFPMASSCPAPPKTTETSVVELGVFIIRGKRLERN